MGIHWSRSQFYPASRLSTDANWAGQCPRGLKAAINGNHLAGDIVGGIRANKEYHRGHFALGAIAIERP